MNLELSILTIQNSDTRATILTTDLERLSKYKYYLQGNGKGSVVRYVGSGDAKLIRSLATDVMNNDYLYDHKDRDSLNNIPSNLRRCTYSQNAMNRNKRKGCSSQYKGVSWNKSKKLWHAYICLNYNIKCLGYFISEQEAALTYNNAAILLHKEFANLNVI